MLVPIVGRCHMRLIVDYVGGTYEVDSGIHHGLNLVGVTMEVAGRSLLSLVEVGNHALSREVVGMLYSLVVCELGVTERTR